MGEMLEASLSTFRSGQRAREMRKEYTNLGCGVPCFYNTLANDDEHLIRMRSVNRASI